MVPSEIVQKVTYIANTTKRTILFQFTEKLEVYCSKKRTERMEEGNV